MDYEISHGPAFAAATVMLETGESIRCESGAMMSMSGSLKLEARMNSSSEGGFLKRTMGAVAKTALSKESFFITTISAEEGPGEALLAPSQPGDIYAHHLTTRTLVIQAGSYLASAPTVKVDTGWGGFKAMIGGEGLFFLKASGEGLVLLSSFGAIIERDLIAGETYVVDSGHMVAFEEGMPFKPRMAAGKGSGGMFARAITSAKTGEGLVIEFTGPGKIWMQSRNPVAFSGWLAPLLPSNG